jgi:5-methylcytosine-specific restriction endonuclease McrA
MRTDFSKGKLYRKNKQAKKRLIQRGDRHCGICGLTIIPVEKATIDHKMPLALGGSVKTRNAQLAHYICNQIKGDQRWEMVR